MSPRNKNSSNKNIHKAIIYNFNSALWHFHILVPKSIATNYIEGNNRRVVCLLKGTESFQCALMPDGNGDFFININKKLRDKLKLKEGDEVTYNLEKDTSEFGLPVPEEFAELLKIDAEGNDIFMSLTPGKQRTLLYMVSTPKSIDLRIKRAICIIDHLKATNGKINYRQLNELIKNSS
jgi:Domain of unknown function (DUF1905)/Bacteriocin-protection, YdeI or OmpD-Associated